MTTPAKLKTKARTSASAAKPAEERGRRYRVRERGSAGSSGLRVNARLDDVTSQRLEVIMEATGASVTEALKAAIHTYHDTLAAKAAPSPQELALRLGLIGCGTGPEDLSIRYKEYLTESLAQKHGHR